jgi:hypothetical protein
VNRAVEECTAPETPYYSTRVGSPMAGVCRVEIGRGERGRTAVMENLDRIRETGVLISPVAHLRTQVHVLFSSQVDALQTLYVVSSAPAGPTECNQVLKKST